MKISILQQDLYPHLQAVTRSVGVRATLPVLANILLKTEGGKLILAATNLEIGVIKKINAKIEEEGEISIPAKTLLEVVASLISQEITIQANQDQLEITTLKFKASINGISAAEFPAIPLVSDQTIELNPLVLKNSLPQITYAAAVEEGRPVLTGILTEINKEYVEFVATDGFRLAHKRVATKSSSNFKALIPRRTFEEVVRIIDEELGELNDSTEDKNIITLSTSENQNQIIFQIGQTQLSSRLIEGQFPSWEKIVPKTFQNRVVVERSELLKAVKLASVFAKDGGNIIRVKTAENTLTLTSETKEIGSQETSVEAQVEGSEILIAFNSKFLTEALSSCSNSQVSIEFSGNLTAALIKPIGEEGLEYIVMPVRLS